MIVSRLVIFAPAFLFFSAAAQTPNRGHEFYREKILPVLESSCYKCHSVESEKSKGGLLLDSAEAMKKGGDTGPGIVPGNAAKSLVYEAITYSNSDMEMPPKKQLSAEVIKDFETWIRGGAPIPPPENSPGSAPAMTGTLPEPTQGGKIKDPQGFWAFKRPIKQSPGKVKLVDWPKNVVDRFVLAEMEKHQLSPVADADKPTLIRRAYFDLIGLPPSAAQLDAFVKDDSPDAFSKVIDRLLASEHFGERWGRHWLDVARYAESNGGDSNVTYPHAWRYRDYVIDSFNKDKPYDRFLTEQIAGDLLEHANEAERTEHLLATGFLALGTKNLLQRSTLQFQLDMADEQIDATSRAFLGMTIACARCHDHKFDPISQKDYYAMAGIFMSSNTEYGTLEQTDYNLQSDTLLSITVNDGTAENGTITAEERAESEARIAEIESELLTLRRGGSGGMGGKGKGGKGGKGKGSENMEGGGMDEVTLRRTRIRLQRELDHETNYLKKFDTEGNALTQAMGVMEGNPHDIPVYLRGELDTPGETVERGFVSFLEHRATPKIPSSQSGRLELAQWLTDPENSLTSRVMMNRLWGKLFGSPLVASTDNFGGMGQTPTHPELLDLLAVVFRDSGWSVKKMIRGLMLTRTYQLSSTVDQSNYAIDPDNIYLWRASQKRLEAEVLRDTVLFVSGQLEKRPLKSQIYERGDVQVGDVRRRLFELPDYDVRHRSVYLPILRGYLPDSLALFDFAEPSLVVGTRNDTLVPAQALYMMNSDFIQDYSRIFSEGMVEKDDDATNRIRQAYRVILSRTPSDEELGVGEDFIQQYSALMTEEGLSQSEAETEALAALTQSLFSNAEFRYLN